MTTSWEGSAVRLLSELRVERRLLMHDHIRIDRVRWLDNVQPLAALCYVTWWEQRVQRIAKVG